ncbi:Cell division control protein 6-like [Holothuria leucospilota]|uniref:Cell division control protein n=1 Tax=Holothuria leucospilota TaxID=206669 RepID=A0A9Q0YF98_HOLLE|nr:Cell division control protein 6-like [Holothuria leucospilota]
MPITTRSRSQVQSTLQFRQRKSRVSTVKDEIKSKRNGNKKQARSKSVPPANTGTENNILKRVSASTRNSMASQKSTGAEKNLSSPVSPRKRRHSGGSNKENKSQDGNTACSPTKISRPSRLKSPLRGLNLDKLEIKGSSPQTNVSTTPKKDSPRSPGKSQSSSPTKRSKKLLSLHRQQDESYTKAKRALHTSLPDRLLCRDKEIKSIQGFLHEHILKKKPGSLYISGAPGTGKTACLKYLLEEDKKLSNVQTVFVNCMTVRQSQGIFGKILKEVDSKASVKMNMKDAQRQLQKKLTTSGPVILLVLDEIDHLDSKGQEVLYTMFEWPSIPRSRLVLLGIANALDLTDRILPRLQARPKCAPQLLHFQPFTMNQIVSILQDRLQASNGGTEVLESIALQLCARKVAAVSGDIRKALDVCRRAVEVVEADVGTQTVLSPKAPKQLVSPVKSPQKSPKKSPLKKVSLQTISSVLGEVYGSNIVSSSNQSQTFPLQQKLAICTLLLIVKEGKKRETTLGKLHEIYCKICQRRQVPSVDQSEFFSICQLIETRGVMEIKSAKDTRQTKYGKLAYFCITMS